MEASFQYPQIGQVTWGDNGWNFTFPLAANRRGDGTIIATDPNQLPPEERLQAVVRYLAWFRKNDTVLRAFIAEQMFEGWLSGWYDEEIDRTRTCLGFQRKLSLAGIDFYWEEKEEPWVSVLYDDGELFGGHAIEIVTDLSGKINIEPTLVG